MLGRALYGPSFATSSCKNRIYVGGGSAVLSFDISNPEEPLFLGHFYTDGIVWNIFVENDTLYIANGKAGITILDFTQPESPKEVGRFEIQDGENAYGIFLKGDTAYAAVGSGGMLIINVENPHAPILIGSYRSDSLLFSDIFVIGSLAFCGIVKNLSQGYLGIFDLENPSSPESLIFVSQGNGFTPRAVFVTEDTTVYVAAGLKDLIVYRAKDPRNPVAIGSYITSRYGLDVWVEGNLIYLADGYAAVPNFIIFDTSDIDLEMNPVGIYKTTDFAWGVTVKGRIAFVADEWAGLHIVDCTSPQNPAFLSWVDIGGYTMGIYLSQSLLYAATEGGNLRVVDVHDPSSPQEVGYFDTWGRATDVWVRNDTAFIAEGFDTIQGPRCLEIVDFSDLMNPSPIGNVTLPSPRTYADLKLFVSERNAFLTDGRNGLWILDISEPDQPQVVGQFTLGSLVQAQDVAVSQDIAYLAYGKEGVFLLDVSDPSFPFEIGHIDPGGQAMGVEINGDVLSLAAGDSGVYLIDVGDPTSPKIISHFDTEGNAKQVVMRNFLAFVADGLNGVRTIDFSTPQHPQEVGYYYTSDRAVDLTISADTLYVADITGGLYILQFYGSLIREEAKQSSQSTQISVSLSKGGAWFEFKTSRPAWGHLQIYSATGRLVWEICVRRNSRRIFWEGRDVRGFVVPSGIYFVLFQSGETRQVKKFLLLR